jgi:hypothetical protein
MARLDHPTRGLTDLPTARLRRGPNGSRTLSGARQAKTGCVQALFGRRPGVAGRCPVGSGKSASVSVNAGSRRSLQMLAHVQPPRQGLGGGNVCLAGLLAVMWYQTTTEHSPSAAGSPVDAFMQSVVTRDGQLGRVEAAQIPCLQPRAY